MRIVLVGPPGAGKGTQAAQLAGNLSIPHISAGDLFRVHMNQDTELGRSAREYVCSGRLAPDDLTIAMLHERVKWADAAAGFLLDGFPRNLAQAQALDGSLDDAARRLDAVLELKLPEDEVVRRIAGRRTCHGDRSHIFHVANSPALVTDVCDICGCGLFQRDDDREDTVRKRLDVYRAETEPIIDHYRAKGLLTTIPALGRVREVTQRALTALGRGEAP